jgi:hypothetical protein
MGTSSFAPRPLFGYGCAVLVAVKRVLIKASVQNNIYERVILKWYTCYEDNSLKLNGEGMNLAALKFLDETSLASMICCIYMFFAS